MSSVNRAAPVPWKTDMNDEQEAALRSLLSGTANEGQQKTAVNAIIQTICETNGLGWNPDSNRASDFAQGKRYVGLRILSVLAYVPKKQDTK